MSAWIIDALICAWRADSHLRERGDIAAANSIVRLECGWKAAARCAQLARPGRLGYTRCLRPGLVMDCGNRVVLQGKSTQVCPNVRTSFLTASSIFVP